MTIKAKNMQEKDKIKVHSQATEEVIHKASFALKDESNFKMTKVKTIFKTKK